MSNIILLFSNLSPIFPIITGWKVKGLLWYYAWICLLCDVAGFIIKAAHLPRYIHANLFLVLEFVLLSWYLCLFILKPGYRKMAAIAIATIAAAFLIHTSFLTPLQTNFVGGAILYGIYIILCIAALYKVMQQIEEIKIERSGIFVFTGCFLLYSSGCMVMLLFKINLNAHNHEALMTRIWDVHNILNILKNLGIAYVFIIPKNEKDFGR